MNRDEQLRYMNRCGRRYMKHGFSWRIMDEEGRLQNCAVKRATQHLSDETPLGVLSEQHATTLPRCRHLCSGETTSFNPRQNEETQDVQSVVMMSWESVLTVQSCRIPLHPSLGGDEVLHCLFPLCDGLIWNWKQKPVLR